MFCERYKHRRLMALADMLTRLDVVYLRGRRLTVASIPVIAAPAQAGVGA